MVWNSSHPGTMQKAWELNTPAHDEPRGEYGVCKRIPRSSKSGQNTSTIDEKMAE
jgi:hypothetical protein